jgi:ankyrin repeat protein
LGDNESLAAYSKTPDQSGAKVDYQMVTGDTALMRAAQSGNIEAAALLLSSGAERDLKNNDGQTALDLSSNYGQDEIV